MVTGLTSWRGLTGDIQETVTMFVRMIAPRPEAGPFAINDREFARMRYLATIAANRAVSHEADAQAVLAGQWALHFGATAEDLAGIDGITPAEAAARYAIPAHYRGDLQLPQRPEWVDSDESTQRQAARHLQRLHYDDDPTGRP